MVKFGYEDAKRVINEMRICYGKKFSDQWSGVTPRELATMMAEKYQDLTPEDLQRGLKKMESSIFVPTIPEFKDWCLGDQRAQWLGANEAWNIAKASIGMYGQELTVVWTKECAIAFDAVSEQVKTGDKFQLAEAKKVFIERYERMVAESLERNEKPLYHVSYGVDKDQRKTALREAEIAGYLPSSETQLLIEHVQSPSDADAETLKFKTTAQEHLAKLKGLLKVNNPKPEQVEEEKDIKLFTLPEKLEGWSDPFDEQEQYIKTLQSEKKAVPLALKK